MQLRAREGEMILRKSSGGPKLTVVQKSVPLQVPITPDFGVWFVPTTSPPYYQSGQCFEIQMVEMCPLKSCQHRPH